MQSGKILLSVIFGIVFLILFITYIKSKKFFAVFFLTFLQGICALCAVNVIGSFIAVHIPVNLWTAGLSAFTGISGVILLLLCETFMT